MPVSFSDSKKVSSLALLTFFTILLNRNGFCEITRFIDIEALADRDIVAQELERNDAQAAGKQRFNARYIADEFCRIFKENDVSISNIAVYNNKRGIEIPVVAYGYKDLSEKLREAGYNVTGAKKLHEHY